MNAIVLAGGYGTRLKPLTDNVPKPMLTVANRPIIDYCVAQLYHYGIRDIVFTLGYKPEQIVEWAIGYTGISAHFSSEDTPLGTLGGVKAAADFLDDTFIVLSGDGISDINLNALLSRHLAAKALVTAVVKKCDNPQLYGVARLGDNSMIEGFIEKPHNIEERSYINCGVYVINKNALNLIEGEKCDFARDLFPVLVEQKKLGYYEHSGYWQDVGDIKSYYDANFDMLKGANLESTNGAFADNGTLFKSVKNFNDERFLSKLYGNLAPSLINVSAKTDGHIDECIIGGGAEISRSASLDRCVVLEGAKAEDRRHGCIIGSGFCIDVFDVISQKQQSGARSTERV